MSLPDTKFYITNQLTKESKFVWRLLHSIHMWHKQMIICFLKKGKESQVIFTTLHFFCNTDTHLDSHTKAF